MFDVQQHFKTKVPILAQSSIPLVYAILAISARQIERQKKLHGDHESLQLYQESSVVSRRNCSLEIPISWLYA